MRNRNYDRKMRTLPSGDLTGKTFDNLIVLERVINRISKSGLKQYVSWKCKCICGKAFITSSRNLKRGQKSCGCLSKSNRFKLFLTEEDAAINYKFSQYRTTAKRRNLEFNLSLDKFKKLVLGNCFYCGSNPRKKLSYHRKQGITSIAWNGIDRINNSNGYAENNCVSCCFICNMAKNNLSTKQFLDWINQIYEYQKNLCN